jgi:tetratricopeptide (TPR) repeat protein
MGLRLLSIAAVLAFGAFGADIESAQRLYDHTNFGRAVEELLPIAEGNAAAAELLGQSYFMLGEYKKATDAFEKAITLDASRSDYYHWLGRAYGRRAEAAFPLTAVGYANKAKSSFEKAVRLEPKNLEAVSDLLEYYLQAPGFMGGGFDKAEKMASLIAEHDAAEGNFARARIAEERKDFSNAEALLRRAIALRPHQVGRILDLAKLLAKEGRIAESDAVFAQAQTVDPGAPKLLYARAETYIKCNRRHEEARQLLTQYLASNISPDDPSKVDARKLLKQVTVKQGTLNQVTLKQSSGS